MRARSMLDWSQSSIFCVVLIYLLTLYDCLDICCSTVATRTYAQLFIFFYAWQQNALHVLAIVEASVRSSVCPSVILWYCVKQTQARITKFSLQNSVSIFSVSGTSR